VATIVAMEFAHREAVNIIEHQRDRDDEYASVKTDMLAVLDHHVPERRPHPQLSMVFSRTVNLFELDQNDRVFSLSNSSATLFRRSGHLVLQRLISIQCSMIGPSFSRASNAVFSASRSLPRFQKA
jgi:hypothetical protein